MVLDKSNVLDLVNGQYCIRVALLTAVKREKFVKVKQNTSKLRLSFLLF